MMLLAPLTLYSNMGMCQEEGPGDRGILPGAPGHLMGDTATIPIRSTRN
jgi:hypothetical protein